MCKFHICATWHIQQKNRHKVQPIRGFVMYFWPCEMQYKTSRDRPFLEKTFGHVFFSTVLADGRCLEAHVPPHTGNGLLKEYL